MKNKSKIQIPDFHKMAEAALRQIPHNIGQMALSHFKDLFRKQGFTDFAFVPWAKRMDVMNHPMLRKSNALMEDLKVTEQTMQRIKIETNLPYAAIHNNGGKFSILITDKMRKYFWAMYRQTGQERFKFMAITKKKRLPIRIPERRFIGDSKVLNDNIDKYLATLLVKTFNNG
ncbi:MAG: phage virion morphogenesis protein [Bacteroidia bacterium]|nr:phage virion morphogenesis protein [Bacteroidia bacterium]